MHQNLSALAPVARRSCLLPTVLAWITPLLGSTPLLAQDSPAAPVPPAADEPDPLARFEEVLRESLQATHEEQGEEDSEPVPVDPALYVWTRTSAVEGLVELYRRRREDGYLERAFLLLDEVLERRDSELKIRDPERRRSSPAWSATSPFPPGYAIVDAPSEPVRSLQPALTAAVVGAGAQLCELVHGEKRLAKVHGRRADALEKELRKALAVFEDEYGRAPAGTQGYYHPFGKKYICLTSAELALLGRAHLLLAWDGRHRNDSERAEQIAEMLQTRLRHGPDGVTWTWAPRPSQEGIGGRKERVFHAGWLAEFADLCLRAELVFEEKDLDSMYATFERIVWASGPKVPLVLEPQLLDGSSTLTTVPEAYPWLSLAARDERYLPAARRALSDLPQGPQPLALPFLAALVEPSGLGGGGKGGD